MKPSAAVLLAIAMLAGNALFTAPVLASDSIRHSGFEAESVIWNSGPKGVQSHEPMRRRLMTLATWLSTEFGLSFDTLPHIEFVTTERLSALRFRGVASDHQGDGRDVVAVYDDDAQSIYLSRGW